MPAQKRLKEQSKDALEQTLAASKNEGLESCSEFDGISFDTSCEAFWLIFHTVHNDFIRRLKRSMMMMMIVFLIRTNNEYIETM